MRRMIGKALRVLPLPGRAGPVLIDPRPDELSWPTPTLAPEDVPEPLAMPHEGVAWLLAGSRVLTRPGEAPVEALENGAEVMALGSGAQWRPVVRVAARRVEPLQPSGMSPEAPVLIQAGALRQRSPLRDLFVAPGQGIWLEGVVTPAHLLVNGTSIRRDHRRDPITYHSVVMADPALIVVEGALLETGPGGEGAPGVAPLLLGGPALVALRRRLEERARDLAEAH